MMHQNNALSQVWIKAAMLGTTWAASEIVLGSFLHNLRIPFSGNFLTAIGLVILISAAYRWHDKGLFWRAGLICAIMKTMSPSAVIFGPMIAITAEAFLLEFSTRFLGRNFLGFFVGSILAMSWVLIQRLGNFIIFYGFNIVELYANLMKYVEKQLQTSFDMLWLPLIILFLVNTLFALVSAFIGIKAGKELVKMPKLQGPILNNSDSIIENKKSDDSFVFSLKWLFFNFGFMVFSLWMISNLNWYFWSSAILVIIFIWSLRYRRALKQLSKPKFWIVFVLITLLSAFVFSATKSLEEALYIGLQMNFRAALLVIGFSILGKELYNPIIRNFFNKTAFRQLPMALDLAFQALPTILANLPPIRVIIRHPMSTVRQMMLEAESRFDAISNAKAKVYFVVGERGAGKTTALLHLMKKLKANLIPVSGILSLRNLKNDITVGYDLFDVETGAQMPFLTLANNEIDKSIGRYSINEGGLSFGLNSLFDSNSQLVFIDEVGRLEISGKGWAKAIPYLIANKKILVFGVRSQFVNEVVACFDIDSFEVILVNKMKGSEQVDGLLSRIKFDWF